MFDMRPVLTRAGKRIDEHLTAMHAARRFILGQQVQCFEKELAASFGGNFAVGSGSGTAGLELRLQVAGIVRAEQEVITPVLTSLVTGQAVLAAGLGPLDKPEVWVNRSLIVISCSAGTV